MSDRHTADSLRAAWEAATSPGDGGCVIWTGGAEGPWQVPYFRYQGRKYSARRVAWEFTHGSLPSHQIATSCGTARCVAPDHLCRPKATPQRRAAAANRDLRPLADRFWEKVERRGTSDCWPWVGKVTTAGYGQISRGRNADGLVGAHRLAYELSNGTIPDGLIIRHRCDNRICVNPGHLEVGTHLDNMRDRAQRGRTAQHRGVDHPQARLTEDDVLEIRRLAAVRTPQKVIAARYGVSQRTVSDIALRRRWRHVS
jgi:hypothetical protein